MQLSKSARARNDLAMRLRRSTVPMREPRQPASGVESRCTAKKKAAGLRTRLYERSSRCYWCDKQLAFTDATVEHVIRRCDGGRTTMENCVIACGPCNHNRGAETDPAKVVALAARAKTRARMVGIKTIWWRTPVTTRTMVAAAKFQAEINRILWEQHCAKAV